MRPLEVQVGAKMPYALRSHRGLETRMTMLRPSTEQISPSNGFSVPGLAISAGEESAVETTRNHRRAAMDGTSKFKASQYMFIIT